MTRTLRAYAFVLALGLVMGGAVRSEEVAKEPVADPDLQLNYQADVLPLLTQYCGECHQGDNSNGGVTLEALKEDRASTRDKAIWKKIHVQLTNKIMPPVDQPQPTDEERQKMVGWINSHAMTLKCDETAYPGRVTIRRLNRAEYNNTIRDLFGIDFQPASTFPADDTGYGFDNIGDVLTLPPVLLERYLEAAEQVTRRAILAPDEDFIVESSQPGGTLVSKGEVAREFEFPVDAEYDLKILAYADQAGPDLAKMSFLLDGQELMVSEIKATKEGEADKVQMRVKVTQGKHTLAGGFLNDYFKQMDDKTEDRNLYLVSLSIAGPIGVLPKELPESHRRIMVVAPKSVEDYPAAATAILSGSVPRIWRRPTTDEEIQQLVKLALNVTGDGGSFERGIQTSLQAALISPRFLFRLEQDPAEETPNAVRDLNDFELASRLSYFLWSSSPDEELFEAARQGKLTSPEELNRQARRMLADSRSKAIVENFASQWLQLRSLAIVNPDRKRYPQFQQELRGDMRRETEMLFDSIIREDRSILEFLSADYTFVNERLAGLYGIEGVTGDEFRRVSVNPEQRGGLLGQASILTVTSNPTRTSPVKRGKWILENLLASPPPPAPANVPPLKEAKKDEKEELSLKERMARHRSDPACASCHVLMDPLGFGLENYDAIGGWRSADGDATVDATGDLPDGRKFTGPKELRSILLERSDDFRRCFSDRLLTYSLGRGLEYFDECAVQEIVNQGQADGDKFSAYVVAIVNSSAFRQRGRVALPD